LLGWSITQYSSNAVYKSFDGLVSRKRARTGKEAFYGERGVVQDRKEHPAKLHPGDEKNKRINTAMALNVSS
jgi:hypothetical protein